MPYPTFKYIPQKKYKPGPKFKLAIKKSFLKWMALSVILLIVFIVVSPWTIVILRPQVDQKITELMHRSKGRQLEFNSVHLGVVQLTQGGLIFNQVQAHGTIRYQYPYFQPRHFAVYIPMMQINFKYGFSGGFRVSVRVTGLEVKGGAVISGVEESQRRLESISDVNFKTAIHIGMSPWKWKRHAVKWARQFKSWALDGQQMKNIDLSGNANFAADGARIKVYFYSRKDHRGAAYLEGNPEDLRRIAQAIEPKFTNEDIAIASRNLLKTPALLDIRTRAEKKSEEIYKSELGIGDDAIRHIFWSYWLTQKFGADFALRATDAHEIGDFQNTDAEHEKDRRNNALGIEYAQRKFSEDAVEKIIFTDSRIPRIQTA